MSQPAVETQQPAVAARPRRTTDRAQGQARLAWLLLTPTLLVIAFVALFPLVQTVYLSFTNARLASAAPTEFVGLRNYVELARDTIFLTSIKVTVLFTVITVAFEFVLGL